MKTFEGSSKTFSPWREQFPVHRQRKLKFANREKLRRLSSVAWRAAMNCLLECEQREDPEALCLHLRLSHTMKVFVSISTKKQRANWWLQSLRSRAFSFSSCCALIAPLFGFTIWSPLFYFHAIILTAAGIERKFQLRTVLPSIQRKSWQVPRRRAEIGRLPVQWTCWISWGESLPHLGHNWIITIWGGVKIRRIWVSLQWRSLAVPEFRRSDDQNRP